MSSRQNELDGPLRGDEYRQRLISKCEQGGHLHRRPGDGEWVYVTDQGSCLSSEDLIILATELERRNKDNQSGVDN